MAALIHALQTLFLFLAYTLLQLAEFAFLMRLLLQWGRADFRNPLARALVQVTNPVLVPLRRVLPAIGQVDTASVLLVLVLAVGCVWVDLLRIGLALPIALPLLKLALLQLVKLVLYAYYIAIIAYALLSMLQAGAYSPMLELLGRLTEPVLRPLRRLPQPANLDLSPLWACILIQALLLLLP